MLAGVLDGAKAAAGRSYERVAADLDTAARSAGHAAPLWIDWYASALRTLEADGRFDAHACQVAARTYAYRMDAIFGNAAQGE